jgi:RNA polymerase sigma-70 factor (ECF subfamily)
MEERGYELADPSGELPEEMLLKKEEVASIWQAVKSVDAKHRAVLALRYFDGLSYDEIAKTLHIPLGTVKSRLNVAVNNLRRQMLKG